MPRPDKRSTAKAGIELRTTATEADAVPLVKESIQVVCQTSGLVTTYGVIIVTAGVTIDVPLTQQRIDWPRVTTCEICVTGAGRYRSILTSQRRKRQHQSHAETEVADPTFCLTQSQCTDTGLTSASADPLTARHSEG